MNVIAAVEKAKKSPSRSGSGRAESPRRTSSLSTPATPLPNPTEFHRVEFETGGRLKRRVRLRVARIAASRVRRSRHDAESFRLVRIAARNTVSRSGTGGNGSAHCRWCTRPAPRAASRWPAGSRTGRGPVSQQARDRLVRVRQLREERWREAQVGERGVGGHVLGSGPDVIRLHVGPLSDTVRPLERHRRRPVVVHHDAPIAASDLDEGGALGHLAKPHRPEDVPATVTAQGWGGRTRQGRDGPPSLESVLKLRQPGRQSQEVETFWQGMAEHLEDAHAHLPGRPQAQSHAGGVTREVVDVELSRLRCGGQLEDLREPPLIWVRSKVDRVLVQPLGDCREFFVGRS